MGGRKGRVPWARLEEARAQYILAEYLLNDVTLTQFHHNLLEDADALLKHWTQRQAAGEIPLRFKKKGKQCGKKASVPNNASDLAVPRGQSEGGPEDAQEGQELGSYGGPQADSSSLPNEESNSQRQDATKNSTDVS
jgi:hypothetical protein